MRAHRPLAPLALIAVLIGLTFAQTAGEALASRNLLATGTIELAFTPWDDAEGALLRALGEAKRSIHVQTYLLTSRNITRALLEAARRGVKLQVLADREQALRAGKERLEELVAAGISVRLEVRYAAAHNKVILIDAESNRPTVITGSYNFTFSAQARNAENLLILRDNPLLARAYLANWQRHAREALAYDEALAP